jgi:hypothetical protein
LVERERERERDFQIYFVVVYSIYRERVSASDWGYQRARRLTLFYVDPPYSIGSEDWLRVREREREIFRYILLLSIVYIYIERE